MKRITKFLMIFTMFITFLVGCSTGKSNVTASIAMDTFNAGRNKVEFTLNVNDDKAKDGILNSNVTVYIYELIPSIDGEEESLAKSKSISETVTEVEIDGLEENKKYRLIVKKTSGEQKDLLVHEFKTNDLGSKNNPILISTVEEFMNISEDLSAYYKLANDIDFVEYVDDKGISEFSSIGTSSKPFKGVLDGNGKTIRNISNMKYTSNSYYYGIFASVDYQGVIKNVTFENITFSTKGSDDKLATKSIEYLGIVAGYNEGTIEGVTLKNVNIEAGISRSIIYVGLAAGVNDGTIENVKVEGNLKIESTTSNIYAGGLCGMIGKDVDGFGKRVAQTSLNVTIDVKTARNSLYLGGIAGETKGDIENVIVTGTLRGRSETTATSDYKNTVMVGGIVGKQVKGYLNKNISSLAITLESTFAKEIKLGGIVGQTGVNNISYCLSNSTINVVFDTEEQMNQKVDEVSPYYINFLYGANEDAEKEVTNVTKCYLSSNTYINITVVEQTADNIVSDNVVETLNEDFYANTLKLSSTIWELGNLNKNMPVLK